MVRKKTLIFRLVAALIISCAVTCLLLYIFSVYGQQVFIRQYPLITSIIFIGVHLIICCCVVVGIIRRFHNECGIIHDLFINDEQAEEIDLRKFSFFESQHICSAANDMIQIAHTTLSDLNRINDTLSIDINHTNGELVKINKKLQAEIQKHKETEVALDKARINAEAANKAKSEFLTNMRHEIRTPMNAVIGMTSLVLDSDLTEKQSELLTIVHDSSHSLLKVINDILDLSRIESNEVSFVEEMFVLNDSLNLIIRPFRAEAEKKGVEFTVSVGADVPSIVRGDYSQLNKVISNLLSNAVKFTQEGAINVNVGLERIVEDEAVVVFEVADTGVGINPELIEDIFIPFHQVDGSYTRKYEGVGLGLSIAARISEKMGGIMWCDSEPGAGSVFRFIVRLKIAQLS